MKVAVITGGTSGIGKACCELFVEKGFSVYEISRRETGNGAAKHIRGDIRDEKSVRAALKAVYDAEGRVDVLVNNAGFGISGPAETTELEDAKSQFDTNFFGTFTASRLAIPYLRETRGRIVNVSSIAAIAPIPFQSFYAASKAAINSLSLSMANELKPFGIKVLAVMPGDVKTGFTDARIKGDGGELYAEALKRSVEGMEKDERNGMAPQKIAEAVYRAATSRHPRPLRTKGFQYHAVAALIKLLPVRTSNYLIGKLYG